MENVPTGIIEYSKRFIVDKKRIETLPEYVKRIRVEKGLSFGDIERNSRSTITASYVNRIENGVADADGMTPKKLIALAKGLGVLEEEIFRVVRGKPAIEMSPHTFSQALEALGVTEFASFSETLNPDEMEEIIAVLRTQLEVKYNRKKKTKK